MAALRNHGKFGTALFTLDAGDHKVAVDFGLFCTNITINQDDARGDGFGLVYDKKRNIVQVLYDTQMGIQTLHQRVR